MICVFCCGLREAPGSPMSPEEPFCPGLPSPPGSPGKPKSPFTPGTQLQKHAHREEDVELE